MSMILGEKLSICWTKDSS